MRFPHNGFSRWHIVILVVMWMMSTMLTLTIVATGLSSSPEKSRRVWMTTAATPLGPMTGAISRGGQSCCLAASLSLLAYCGPALGIAALIQCIDFPNTRWIRGGKLVAWAAGLLVWFGGGILSLGHAVI